MNSMRLHQVRAWLVVSVAALLVLVTAPRLWAGAGPSIDWDPAYCWQVGGTATNLPSGGEFKIVGIISSFDSPFQDLNAGDPNTEFTFYVHGLISQGTVASGPPSMTLYTTNFTGGTIEVYQGSPRNAAFDPNPPNATVPANFTDGTMILSGSFTSFVVQSNNFTAFDSGNIEGDLNWTGGTLYYRTFAIGGVPCPGLFTGGATWNPSLLYPGYLFRHAGKIDLQCPTPAVRNTWGALKSLYR